MKNKKAQGITLTATIKLILFAVVMLLIVIPLGFKIWGFFTKQATQTTVQSMGNIVRSAKYLQCEKVIALEVDKNHMILGFDVDDPDKPCAEDRSCLCVCDTSGCAGDEDRVCTSIVHGVTNENIRINGEFKVEETEGTEGNIVNHLLSINQHRELEIEPAPGMTVDQARTDCNWDFDDDDDDDDDEVKETCDERYSEEHGEGFDCIDSADIVLLMKVCSDFTYFSTWDCQTGEAVGRCFRCND